MNRRSTNEPKHYSREEENGEKGFDGNTSIEIEQKSVQNNESKCIVPDVV